MASPIPGLLLGKNPTHLNACKDAVMPDCEFVKTASSVEEGKAALDELMDGKKIRFVCMGGGFSMADFEEVRGHANSSSLPWFRPKTTKPGAGPPPAGAPAGPPAPEIVGNWLRTGLEEHLEELKQGKGAGDIWYF